MANNENNRVGALWTGKTKTKDTYLNGTIEVGDEKLKVVIFKNSFKNEQKDGAPDYIVYKSQEQNSGTKKTAPVKKSVKQNVVEDDEESDEGLL